MAVRIAAKHWNPSMTDLLEIQLRADFRETVVLKSLQLQVQWAVVVLADSFQRLSEQSSHK